MKLVPGLASLLGITAVVGAQTNVEEITDRIAAAAMRGDVAAVRSLVEQDGGAGGAGGTTALLNSARVGQLAVIKAMCEAGADPNRLGRKGSLPLLLAVGGRQPAAVRLLLEHGADPNKVALCSEPKCTKHPALPLAVYVGDAESVKALLAVGADVAWHEHQATQAANINGDVAVFDLLKRAGGREWTEHPAVKLKLPGAAEAAERAQERAATPIAPSAFGFTEIIPTPTVPAARQVAGGKCRMAILADEANRASADLLAAKLSGGGALELVERSEIEKILTEQKLARDFSADAANAAQLGALLRADALVLIRTRQIGEAPLIETRLVRVNPGLILDTAYRPAPLVGQAEWAAQTAARITPLAGKSIARDGVAFSILNLRATLGSLENRLLEQKATALLTDRLVHQPQFYVLERSALDRLAREIGGDGKSSFWTGSFLLDGSIDAAGGASDTLSLTIRLQSIGGETIGTFTKKGRAENLPAVLDAAVGELATSLGKNAQNSTDDLPAEAAAYAREAAWAKACGIPLAASAAAETAWALGNRSADVARLRVEMASNVIEKQAERTGDAVHRVIGWDGASPWVERDFLNHPLRPADALPEEALVNLAAQAAAAWREVLDARPDGIEREAWLKTGTNVCESALLAVVLVDTAAAKIRIAEPLRTLKAELRAAVEAALAAAKDTPQFTEFCMFKAHYARAFIDSPEELAAQMAALLPLHFPEDDLLARARLREAMNWAGAGNEYRRYFSINEYRGGGMTSRSFTMQLPLPFPDRALDILAPKLIAAPAMEDQFLGRTLQLHRHIPGFRFLADLDKAREAMWELRHVIAEDTRTLAIYPAMLPWKFAFRPRPIPESKEPPPPELPPNALKLRYDFFLALCGESTLLDAGVAWLLDPDLYNDAQKHAVHDAIEAHLARVKGAANLPADYATDWRKPNGPKPKPAPVAPGIQRITPVAPAPENTERLRIDKTWGEPWSGNFSDRKTTSFYQMFWAEDAIWFFTETTDASAPSAPGIAHLVRVDLPSLREKMISLPTQPGITNRFARTARVLVLPSQFIVTYPGRYLAVCDRTSDQWKFFPAIKPDGDVVPLDGQLFLTVKDDESLGVMRFDLATAETELLVSTRRNPRVSPLDIPTLHFNRAFSNQAGEFVLWIQSRETGTAKDSYWAWSPTTRMWRESAEEKWGANFYKQTSGFTRSGNVLPSAGDASQGSARAVMAARVGGSARPGLPLLVDFTSPPGVPFGKQETRNGDGKDTIMRPSEWRQCPQGYIFTSGGYRFWFLSNEEFAAFTKTSPEPQ